MKKKIPLIIETLGVKHSEHINKLNEEQKKIDEYTIELNELEQKYNEIANNYDLSILIYKNKLYDKINELKKTISLIKIKKNDYYNKNAHIIFNYNNNELNYKYKNKTKANNVSKKEFFNKYLQLNDSNYNFTFLNDNNFICSTCNVKKILNKHESKIICPSCNEINDIVTEGEKPSLNDPPPEPRNFTYIKYGHFCNWLLKIQGRETCDIPQEVYDNIKKELKLERIHDYSTISDKQIKRYLSKYAHLGYSKFNDHTVQIYINLQEKQSLGGEFSPISLTLEQEFEFKKLFLLIQGPYNMFKKEKENFGSYSYLIYKFAQLLGYDDICKKLKLLKDKDKINKLDTIWKQILEFLGGEEKGFIFIPTY